MHEIKVEIADATVVERTNSNDRGTYTFREQSAWAHLPGVPYPKEIKISLKDKFAGHAPGWYTLPVANFEINRYGQLGLQRYLILESTDAPKAED